jgi:diguanylate cyclase
MTATYNHWLVFLSIVIATLASYTALDLAKRITASAGIAARAWLLGGAFSMGVGIWSMHFVGMLAFSLPIPLGYDLETTLASLVISIVVSEFALSTVSRDRLDRKKLMVGGVLMGLGICAMHYTGMAAIPTHPHVTYDPLLFAASVVIAIGASLAALWIAFSLRTNAGWKVYAKFGSALVMGIAITGMHYTGMAAAHFDPNTVCMTGPLVDNLWLAGTISAVAFSILTVTLGLSLKQANDELQRSAFHDPLTALPNRLLLEDRIERAISLADRGKSACTVMFIDLDRFKQVNDSFGHVVGDELLRAVASRLRGAVRTADTVSRMGGDEFAILLPQISGEQGAVELARKLISSLAEPFHIHGHTLYARASIGISLFPAHGRTAQALLSHADAAMYEAKQEGRNDYRVFAPGMNTFAPERFTLEQDMREALERHEFVLHYQPKVNVQSGAVVGMEALLRWEHPQKGFIPPDQFIPLAEECGLIIPLGRWILEEACAQNKRWQNAGMGQLRVAVNLSGAQFRQRDLLENRTRRGIA